MPTHAVQFNVSVMPGYSIAAWAPNTKNTRPQLGRLVLMFSPKSYDKVGIGCYNPNPEGNRFTDIMGDPIRYQPTHWAYLPEPPTA